MPAGTYNSAGKWVDKKEKQQQQGSVMSCGISLQIKK
jgi:hypothetical protein